MEIKYQEPTRYQKVKENVKKVVIIAAILYSVGGSALYADKTGHQSADLTTGISQPTKLEKFILEYFEFKN